MDYDDDPYPAGKYLRKIVSFTHLPFQVSQVYPAFNETFLFLSFSQKKAFQVSLEGEAIREFNLHSNHCTIVEDLYLIELSKSGKQILVTSLKNGELITLPHLFVPHYHQTKVMVFKESKIFCLQEKGQADFEALTCFSYDHLDSKSKPWKKLSFPYDMVQLDDCSLLGFLEKSQNGLLFRTYSLQKGYGPQMTIDMNQTLRNIMTSSQQSGKDSLKLIRKINSDEYLLEVWHEYYFLKTEDSSKAFISTLEMSYEGQPIHLKKASLLPCYFQKLFVFENERILLADLRKKEVVGIDHKWKNSCRRVETLMGGRLFIEFELDQGSVRVRMTDWNSNMKDIYLHLLLWLNEDFDDDLLFDCIEITT